MQFFFNSYVDISSAEFLQALHIVINSIIQIIAFFLLSNYLFHLTVEYKLAMLRLIVKYGNAFLEIVNGPYRFIRFI